jgi:hypothetical protein
METGEPAVFVRFSYPRTAFRIVKYHRPPLTAVLFGRDGGCYNG